MRQVWRAVQCGSVIYHSTCFFCDFQTTHKDVDQLDRTNLHVHFAIHACHAAQSALRCGGPKSFNATNLYKKIMNSAAEAAEFQKMLLPVLATKYEDCRGLKQNAIAYNCITCITSFYWKRTTCRTLSKLFRTQLDPLRSQALRTLPSDTTLAVKQCKTEENCAILTEEKHEHASAWIRFTAPLLFPTFAAQ